MLYFKKAMSLPALLITAGLFTLVSCNPQNSSSGSSSGAVTGSENLSSRTIASTSSVTGVQVVHVGFESGTQGLNSWGSNSIVSDAATGSFGYKTISGGAGLDIVSKLKAGVNYRFSVKAKRALSSDSGSVGFKVTDTAGRLVFNRTLGIHSTTYSNYSYDFVMPADAAKAEIYIWKNSGTALFTDDWSIHDLSAPAPTTVPSSAIVTYDFENGFPLSYGSASNLVAEQPYSGAHSYRLFSGGAGVGVMQHLVQGNTYRISGYFKQTVAGENGTFGIRFMDSNRVTIMDKQTWPSSTSYQKHSIDVTVPLNATDALIHLWKNQNTGYMYTDKIEVTLLSGTTTTPTPPPAPVNTAPVVNAGADQSVTDTDGNGSQAVILAGKASDAEGNITGQVVRNGSTTIASGASAFTQTVNLNVGVHTLTFEATDAGGLKHSDDMIVTVSAPAPAPTTPTTPPPTTSGYNVLNVDFESGMMGFGSWGGVVALSSNAYAGSQALMAGSPTAGSGAAINILSNVTAGRSYRASGFIKLTGAESGSFNVKFQDGAQAAILSKSITINSTSYQNYSIDFIAPAGAQSAFIYIWKNAGSANMLLDNVVLTDLSSSGGTTTSPTPGTSTGAVKNETLYGVNLAGAEFGSGFVYDRDYTYPKAHELDYFKSKGLTLIRVPFKWQRMQRSLYAPLDALELSRLREVTAAAAARGMKLVLDAHNYGRYKFYNADGTSREEIIGSPSVPFAAFRDFWKKMAQAFANDPGVYAYDTMNEPHDMGSYSWPTAAQEAVNGIREFDMKKLIYTEGTCWSGAHSWRRCNENLKIVDPANNHAYQAHQYFDNDNSGTYDSSYDGEGAYPMVGADRLRPFVEWLKLNGYRGMIGEYGVPKNDPRWNTVLDNFMKAMHENCLSGTYWASGTWWGDYQLSIHPAGGADQPQMLVLQNYKSNPACSP